MSGPSFFQQAQAFREGRFLRVVNYHNTPASEAGQLERELSAYLELYDPVTPRHLDEFYATGAWPLARPGFVAAFYDGYRNNATVAAPVCDRLALTAWFLPPTGWLATDPAQQRAYAEAHDIELLDEELGQDRLAMTWDDLASIGERHVVAAHTGTHAEATDVRTAADARRELVEPRRAIQRCTGQAPAAMAWRYGAPYDPASPVSRALLDAGYRFLVSNTMIQRIAPP